jgi:hypothetical protein
MIIINPRKDKNIHKKYIKVGLGTNSFVELFIIYKSNSKYKRSNFYLNFKLNKIYNSQELQLKLEI